MEITKQKTERRNKVRKRIRSTIRGTYERPRLSVYKSNKHTYAQLINDFEGKTLISASTLATDMRDDVADKPGVEAAKMVGMRIAEKAKDAGIDHAVFDRSGYKYHGKIKAVAEGAREGGLDL
ncbi:MAG: 50S ribosomal protein L18 [Bacteroidota bacterium]|jgi:large subunit ribosomal protein L18